MNSRLAHNRRSFLKQLGAGAVVAPFVTSGLRAASPNGLLHHASFGANGMALSDLTSIASHQKVRLVAVAEVDTSRAAEVRKKFPDAKVYQDWREMLDKEKDLHSVNVSTPDHMHGPMGMASLQRGLHVYGQKPLTHDIYETRRLTEVAREKKLVTQMGIQIHSSREYRTAVRLVQDGAIGKVKEVHTWSSKKWGDNGAMPDRTDPVPETLNWDLWVGVSKMRPYIGNGWYHPGNWRRRLDFGTGTFGDMGCHIYDPVFKALALTAPLSVRSEGPAPNDHSWATDAICHYVFPGTEFTEGRTVNVTWYDGDQRPPADILNLLGRPGEGSPVPDQGSIFVGTKGVLLLPHIAMPDLILGSGAPEYPIPRVEGANHWHQFVNACLGEGKTQAGFDYSGPLTEAILLGSVASRFPKTTLKWDASKLKFSNVSEANQYVKRDYRAGWEVKGL
ncbi:MAG TPA: oxidoreductase [Verrucomicrobiales bacterium]|nr:oxidoreductase [Verrucomicrobiales bacterium]